MFLALHNVKASRKLPALTRSFYVRQTAPPNPWLPQRGDTVYVGMSGGVDSSVVCHLLASLNMYRVRGVFMRNWDSRDEHGTDSDGKGCEWERDWNDVQKVSHHIGVPCEMIDLSREYWTRVFDPSLQAWQRGLTPNPDVYCNKEIKFGALLSRLPAEDSKTGRPVFLATGHYATKDWVHEPGGWIPHLGRGRDSNKDQSYYLSSITEQALRRALFPIGKYTKAEIRQIAAEENLPTANREESMGLCFVGERGRFKKFLSTYLPPSPGNIVNALDGKVVGRHEGLWEFTKGENARIPGVPNKLFVSGKDTEKNIIWVVDQPTHELLHFNVVEVANVHWIHARPTSTIRRFSIQYRYRSKPSWGLVEFINNDPTHVRITFEEPQLSLAEGQVVAFYDAEHGHVLGQGTAAKVHNTFSPWTPPPIRDAEAEKAALMKRKTAEKLKRFKERRAAKNNERLASAASS
ncbi:tRNA methyl transferase-domain-containing protein [Flagelloscypha sp. PMI_526]|nr:tRNA methyl transferase-domain-containing protein [Flagelloscypha sp. PMI_526]